MFQESIRWRLVFLISIPCFFFSTLWWNFGFQRTSPLHWFQVFGSLNRRNDISILAARLALGSLWVVAGIVACFRDFLVPRSRPTYIAPQIPGVRDREYQFEPSGIIDTSGVPGLAGPNIKRTFAQRAYTWKRVAALLFLLGRGFLNGLSAQRNVESLPQFDRSEPMNVTRHVACLFELSLAWTFVYVICATSLLPAYRHVRWCIHVRWGGGSTKPRESYMATQSVIVPMILMAKCSKLSAKISLMYFLQFLAPSRLFRKLRDAYRQGICLFALLLLFLMGFGYVAILGLLAKVCSISFVLEKFWWDAGEAISIAGFINNIAGIKDSEEIAIAAVMRFLKFGGRHRPGEEFLSFSLPLALMESYPEGWQIIFLTLDSSDIHNLLNEANEPPAGSVIAPGRDECDLHLLYLHPANLIE